jgi:hypothetical protein
LLRSFDLNYFQSDSDFQEMFYNFLLHPDLRPFAGVDVTHLRSGEDWERD